MTPEDQTIGELIDQLPVNVPVRVGGFEVRVWSAPTCVRCKTTPSVCVCCSTHGKAMCHRCYRRTHFVEVCVPNCGDCEREGLDPMSAVAR